MSDTTDSSRPEKGHLVRLAETLEAAMRDGDATVAKGEVVFKDEGFRLAVKDITSCAFDAAKTHAKEAQWLGAESRVRPVGIGLRQANFLCRMKHEERLEFCGGSTSHLRERMGAVERLAAAEGRAPRGRCSGRPCRRGGGENPDPAIGVPLVFFQHFTGNLDNWDPALIDRFAQNREVVLFNNRGVASTKGEVP